MCDTGISIPLSETHCCTQYSGCIVKCRKPRAREESSMYNAANDAHIRRCAAHSSGTCSVIKPTGLPSADDIWGINLTRRQLRDLSRALLGRLSCYHTDSGNGFHCWRDIRFPKQFHSEETLLQIHIGWHIRFCTELRKKSISPSFKCLLASFQF